MQDNNSKRKTMEIGKFIDREKELQRIENALNRPMCQFIAIYGRRRVGKSTLIKELPTIKDGIYFLSDTTSETNQRRLFSQAVSKEIPDFDKMEYPDWETMLRQMNRMIDRRITVCLDEFPYLTDSCPSLPSVLQKLLNEKKQNYDLIICGSSQRSMHGLILNAKSPLYGLADEIIKLSPIEARYIKEALNIDSVKAVEEYAVWGGIPRYWELRKDYKTLDEAIARLILDPQGILKEEPNRLLIDDMRDTVQAQTLLSIIGNGANRISEIAARAGSGASTITEPIGRLRELGLVSREVPYGEEPLKSKKGIYHISDSLLRFIYRFSLPYMSILEIAGTEPVMKIVREQFDNYVSLTWENLCREYVAGRSIDGVAYNAGQRWWGKTIDKKTGKQAGEVEIDVVAVSIDKKSVLIGECKWTENEDADRQMNRLREITPNLPFVKEGQKVEYALFLKRKPKKATVGNIFTPGDILK